MSSLNVPTSNMLNKFFAGLILFALTISAALAGVEFVGVAVEVIDGDTISIRDDAGNIHRIRLYGIDAPEKRQSYGIVAELYLAIKISGRTLQVMSDGNDRYGRMIGIVTLDGQNINVELVKNGLAWHYRRYAPKDNLLAENEHQARIGNIGLWSESQPIPPWNYRKGAR